jgi:hypothetical protein
MTVTSKPTKPAKVRPALPRLVDQMRLLLWFQFYLTLLSAMPLFIYGWILQGQQDDLFGDEVAWEIMGNRASQVLILGMATVGSGVLAAICAGLVRRRRIAALLYPLILVAEALIVFVLAKDVLDGVYLGFGVLLSLVLGGWILADLFRGETLSYAFRRR